MNAFDLKNAFGGGSADNFSVLLLKLIMKADSRNKGKLALAYPVEVTATNIFKMQCPFVKGTDEVDWQAIVDLAYESERQNEQEKAFSRL